MRGLAHQHADAGAAGGRLDVGGEAQTKIAPLLARFRLLDAKRRDVDVIGEHRETFSRADVFPFQRSEERRVGKACVSTCRSRGSPYNSKKKYGTDDRNNIG